MSQRHDETRARRARKAPPITLREVVENIDRLNDAASRRDGQALQEATLGLCVSYRPDDARTTPAEPGMIVRCNSQFVFVRYWGELQAKATRPAQLSWAYPRRAKK